MPSVTESCPGGVNSPSKPWVLAPWLGEQFYLHRRPWGRAQETLSMGLRQSEPQTLSWSCGKKQRWPRACDTSTSGCLQQYLTELGRCRSGRAQTLLQKLLHRLQVSCKVLLLWLKPGAEPTTCRMPVTLLPDSQAPFSLRILWLERLSELSPSCFVTLKRMTGNGSGSPVTGITPGFSHEHRSFA